MNALHVIRPYKGSGTWVFDDDSVGLKREPFVSGIPAMIDRLVSTIPDAEAGFRLLFSAQPFPGYQVELTRLHEQYGGTWYRWEGQQAEGWLCPALLKYFPEPPLMLYAKAEAVSRRR
jgi:hypothetical protein